jgi:hypothetical protein
MPAGERVSSPSEIKRKDDPQIVPRSRNLKIQEVVFTWLIIRAYNLKAEVLVSRRSLLNL